jgi:hypothetical protein
MAQRWVTEEEYNLMTQKFQQGGSPQQTNSLQEFFNQLPPELQEKIAVLPPEKQQEVLMQLLTKFNNSQQNVENNQQFAEGGEVDSQQIMQMVAQALQQNTPPEQILQMLIEQGIPQEQATQIIEQVMLQMQEQQPEQEFQDGGQAQSIPVEAERNENLTIQDGQQPQVEGGYLEQQSYNPITGQSTYEIPDNKHNATHDNGGVNMKLSQGDVVNSDKTKIPTDFKVYGKSFKGKTFKDASDYLSKQETKIQDDFAEKVKEGKTDKVSEGALQIMLAKLGKNRNELNELQEQVLESKKQKEANESLKSGVAEYGKVVLEMDKAEHGFNASLDRYLNYKVTDRPVLKAAEGLTASLEKFSKFADKVTSNPNSSLQDIMSAYKQSGLDFNPKDNTAYYKPTFQPINGSQIVGDFKSKIAQKETGAYKNPYIAIAGIGEKEASTHSFEELKSKAASSGIGKYQFIWNIHKNDIKRVTGISKPDDFRYNPQAQEQFMDWFRDNTLLPQATDLKQRYQLPMSIDQIMAMTHLEGKAGLEKKIKAGTLKTSTMANNFKNASPLDYASKFKEGGKIYAGGGNKADFTKVSDFNKQNWEDLNKQAQENFGRTFENPGQYQDYMLKNYPELVKTMFDKGFWSNTNQGETTPTATIPFDDKELYHAFRDNKYNRRGFIPETKTFDSISSYQEYIKDKQKVGGNYYFDPELNTWVSPDINENYYNEQSQAPESTITPTIDNGNHLNRSKLRTPSNNENNITGEDNTEEGSRTPDKETSIMDKLKYGIRESLPYLRNMMLMNEGIINPVLQQKSYQNPYDNFNTDYSIQSALNDSDRSTLTAMADERGNPSVRSARLAQIAANAIAAKAPLYTQKYNQEQQLQNQKVVGQSQYLNQWEDVNRGLKKDFEHEVLQTREVQRQQKNMAIDNMMNNYLRKQEENQAIKLALMETNFDWNKFTQDYEANPEKMKKNFNLQKYLSKNSSTQNNYSMSSDYYIDNKGIPRKIR